MQQQFAFVFPDDINLQAAGEFAVFNAFILTLPFRLRVGRFFTVHAGDSFDVVLRNPLDIPKGTSQDEVNKLTWKGRSFRPRDEFYTEALILDKKPKLPDTFRNEFALMFANAQGEAKLPNTEPRYFDALTRLNDVIVGYHHATNDLFGGSPLERLTSVVFFERLRYLHTIACPESHLMNQQELTEVFDARGDREFRSIPGMFTTSNLDDAPQNTLEKVQDYVGLHQRFLYYQFVLDAKSRMVEGDSVSAILFAVVALEGVHSAILQISLKEQLKQSVANEQDRQKRAEATANRLLMDVGLSESLELTCSLFLSPEDQPPTEELQKCKIGITIRNEIMHALAKKGQYRLRNRTDAQISEAYSAVLKMYRHFAGLVERHVRNEDLA
jgi:hypothetical protein